MDSDVGKWRSEHVEAAELSFQDLVADEETLRGDFLSDCHGLFHKYVVANRGLLREGEGKGRGSRTFPSQDVRVAVSSLPGGQGGGRRLRCLIEAVVLQGSDRDNTWPVHTLLSQIEEIEGEREHSVIGGSVESTPASDVRQLGAVEECVFGRVAVVGASRCCRGKPLGSDTMRPRSLALDGDSAHVLGGEYTVLEYEEEVYADCTEVGPGSGRWFI